MFLNNKQSLYLTGIVILCFFVAGVFRVLGNYMVIAVIVAGFLAVIVNLIMVLKNKKNPE